VRGSVPISIIRTVPESGLEEELEPDIWREIGITAWNRVDGRRCRYNDCRRQWKPYSDVKTYITGKAFSRQQKANHAEKKQAYGNYENLLFHVNLLYLVVHKFMIQGTCEWPMKKL